VKSKEQREKRETCEYYFMTNIKSFTKIESSTRKEKMTSLKKKRTLGTRGIEKIKILKDKFKTERWSD